MMNKKMHGPFSHEMASDRRSRAEDWVYRRHFRGAFFSFRKIQEKNHRDMYHSNTC